MRVASEVLGEDRIESRPELFEHGDIGFVKKAGAIRGRVEEQDAIATRGCVVDVEKRLNAAWLLIFMPKPAGADGDVTFRRDPVDTIFIAHVQVPDAKPKGQTQGWILPMVIYLT